MKLFEAGIKVKVRAEKQSIEQFTKTIQKSVEKGFSDNFRTGSKTLNTMGRGIKSAFGAAGRAMAGFGNFAHKGFGSVQGMFTTLFNQATKPSKMVGEGITLGNQLKEEALGLGMGLKQHSFLRTFAAHLGAAPEKFLMGASKFSKKRNAGDLQKLLTSEEMQKIFYEENGQVSSQGGQYFKFLEMLSKITDPSRRQKIAQSLWEEQWASSSAVWGQSNEAFQTALSRTRKKIKTSGGVDESAISKTYDLETERMIVDEDIRQQKIKEASKVSASTYNKLQQARADLELAPAKGGINNALETETAMVKVLTKLEESFSKILGTFAPELQNAGKMLENLVSSISSMVSTIRDIKDKLYAFTGWFKK